MNSVELTKKLIEIESTDPGVYEFEMEKFIKAFLDNLAPLGVEVFESEVCDGRKNIMGVIRPTFEEGPKVVWSDEYETIYHRNKNNEDDNELILICHMDTVVVGNDWTKEALKATEIDGRIYGRGSTDMKSGLAIALNTFEYVAKVIKKENIDKVFKVIFTVDEEADMKGVEKAIKDGWINSKSYIADLEPTDKMIQVSHKGRFWIKLKVKGKTAHASRPELGIDANACLSEIISFVRKEVSELPDDGELGKSTVTFGLMQGGYEPYVVPDEAFVTMDFRLTPPTYNHDIIRILNMAISNVRKIISDKVVITYEITGDREFVKKDDRSKFLSIIKSVLTELYKKEKNDDYIPVVTSFSGYTDTAVVASKLKNINTLSYGPGSLALAHKPDEYVEIKDIERCEKVYMELLKEVLT